MGSAYWVVVRVGEGVVGVEGSAKRYVLCGGGGVGVWWCGGVGVRVSSRQ